MNKLWKIFSFLLEKKLFGDYLYFVRFMNIENSFHEHAIKMLFFRHILSKFQEKKNLNFQIFSFFLANLSFFSFFWSFFDRFSYLSYLSHWKIVSTLPMSPQTISFSLSLSFSLLDKKKKYYRSIMKKKFIGRYLSFYLCMLLENVICLFF